MINIFLRKIKYHLHNKLAWIIKKKKLASMAVIERSRKKILMKKLYICMYIVPKALPEIQDCLRRYASILHQWFTLRYGNCQKLFCRMLNFTKSLTLVTMFKWKKKPRMRWYCFCKIREKRETFYVTFNARTDGKNFLINEGISSGNFEAFLKLLRNW